MRELGKAMQAATFRDLPWTRPEITPAHRQARSTRRRSSRGTLLGTASFARRFLETDGVWRRCGSAPCGSWIRRPPPPISCRPGFCRRKVRSRSAKTTQIYPDRKRCFQATARSNRSVKNACRNEPRTGAPAELRARRRRHSVWRIRNRDPRAHR
jgi:hypothetical protein